MSPSPALASIGSNSRLPALAEAIVATNELAAFLDACPVVQTEDDAHRGARVLHAARSALSGIERERADRLRPLKDQTAEVRGDYASPEATLDTLTKRLRALLTDFNQAEERRRAKSAETARRAADAAERAAREAEALERDALDDAAAGVVGAGVAARTVEADAAFADHRRASRFARRAEKDVPVRIGGGSGLRAASLRSVEELTVTDPVALIAATGLTEAIHDALRTAARVHRKTVGALPAGVEASITRRI